MIKYNVGSAATIKTWKKPETALKKSLAPRVGTVFINSFKHRDLIYFPTAKYSSQVLEVSSLNSTEKLLKASVLFVEIPENGEQIILRLLSPSLFFLTLFLPAALHYPNAWNRLHKRLKLAAYWRFRISHVLLYFCLWMRLTCGAPIAKRLSNFKRLAAKHVTFTSKYTRRVTETASKNNLRSTRANFKKI